LLLFVNDKLEFSIDSLVNWIVLEEATFTSFSLNNSPLWTTILTRNSDRYESLGHNLNDFVSSSDKEHRRISELLMIWKRITWWSSSIYGLL